MSKRLKILAGVGLAVILPGAAVAVPTFAQGPQPLLKAPCSRLEAIKQAIRKAVEDGRIIQEKADWLLEGLDKGFPCGKIHSASK